MPFLEHVEHMALYLRMMEPRAEFCKITCYLIPKFKHCYASMSNTILSAAFRDYPRTSQTLSARNEFVTTEGSAYLANTAQGVDATTVLN
jgi:hypothetical protein